MSYIGPERRRSPRITGKFVVSYRVISRKEHPDISQTRNISLGGMVLTTNKFFAAGTTLEIDIRLPFFMDTICLEGDVLESKEVVRDLIYDTRICFTKVDPKSESIIKETIAYYQKAKKQAQNSDAK